MQEPSEPPIIAQYPRSDQPQGPEKSWGGCAGAFIMLGIAALLMCGGFAQILAEGPHGPNGEITNDPSIVWLLPLLCGSGLLVGGLAVCFFAYSMGWRRKR